MSDQSAPRFHVIIERSERKRDWGIDQGFVGKVCLTEGPPTSFVDSNQLLEFLRSNLKGCGSGGILLLISEEGTDFPINLAMFESIFSGERKLCAWCHYGGTMQMEAAEGKWKEFHVVEESLRNAISDNMEKFATFRHPIPFSHGQDWPGHGHSFEEVRSGFLKESASSDLIAGLETARKGAEGYRDLQSDIIILRALLPLRMAVRAAESTIDRSDFGGNLDVCTRSLDLSGLVATASQAIEGGGIDLDKVFFILDFQTFEKNKFDSAKKRLEELCSSISLRVNSIK